MRLGKMSCPTHDVDLVYQESEEDVGIGECYYCPEEGCDYVIPRHEFDEHDMDL